MKRILLLSLIVFISLCRMNAEITKEYHIETDGFEWYEVNINGKTGAQDKNGKTIIPAEYKWLNYVSEDDNGYFTCSIESSVHSGLFDKKGKCIVSPMRRYNPYLLEPGDHDASVMVTQTGSSYLPVNQKSKYFTIFNYIHAYDGFYVDKETGTTVNSLYHDISNSKFISVELLIFDIAGNMVFEPKKRYIHLDAYYEKGHFFFITKLLNEENPLKSKFGVIDANENIVIPFKYSNEIKYRNGNFVTMSNGKEIVIGNVNAVKTTKNLFVGGTLNHPESTPAQSSNSSSTQTSQISLKSMIGKHYLVKAFIMGKSILEFEGDLGIVESGILMVYGDGNGNADEFHVYQIKERTSNTKWKISSDRGDGYISISPEFTTKNPESIMIEIKEGDLHNTFLLDSKPHNDRILK